jgi:acetyl-CoA synthetase
MNATEVFLKARNQLLALRENYHQAYRDFRQPELPQFNWALDYFDWLARNNQGAALRVVNDSGLDKSLSFHDLSVRSNQVANLLREQGVAAGDRVLVMLGNVVPLWETMLALIKMRGVIVPTTTLLQGEDLQDRLARAAVKAVVTDVSLAQRFAGLVPVPVRICVGGRAPGWTAFAESEFGDSTFKPAAPTPAAEVLLLYFTSGTTAKPKIVAHTHQSYPVGHLSTMYWLGLRPGDVHLNLSSAGWAKHAWSSFFAPWNAEATIIGYHYERFSAAALLDQLVRCQVTTLCAPPTVWRMLIQEDLTRWPVVLREAASAGEPLNPEVIEQVQRAWGLNVRDGFGQTETTAQVGNPPGEPLKSGSMGRSLPGYDVVLVGADGTVGDEGELCLNPTDHPLGLMAGYVGDSSKSVEKVDDGLYHTGDIAVRDSDGYITYVGRSDDVFKSSDYRISPFELESLLLEHAAVAEAAVVPSPDAQRLAVPKAFVVLAAGFTPDAAIALSILNYARSRLSPFKRIRRIEFAELPKTISGKIRRVELRQMELNRAATSGRRPYEFWEEDLPSFSG